MKLALRMAIFLLILFVADRMIGAVLKHYFFLTTDGDTGGQINGLLQKKCDVLVMGSSRAECQYVPDVLSKQLGATVFNGGFKGANSIYDYGLQQLVFDTYTPKLIIYDFSSRTIGKTKIDPYESLYPLYPFWRNPCIWELIKQKSPFEWLFFLSNIYPYNSKIHSIIIFNALKNRPGVANGYKPQTAVMKSKIMGGDLKEDERIEDERLVFYLEKFLISAHEHGVKLVFVMSPRYVNGKYHIPISIKKIIQKYDYPVFDFDLAEYHQFKDWQLFADYIHLNNQGAPLFSQLLGEKIRELELLP
jgi:hypothetical protein